MRHTRSTNGSRRTSERGQSLAEFALVFPLFWMVLIALIEFAFAFQAVLAVSFSSRNAAVIAAEAGPAGMADCAILKSIEGDLTAPSSPSQIQKVDIYWTDSNGVIRSGATTTYTRSGSTTIPCTVNGASFTVPYAPPSPNGYPIASRCAVVEMIAFGRASPHATSAPMRDRSCASSASDRSNAGSPAPRSSQLWIARCRAV